MPTTAQPVENYTVEASYVALMNSTRKSDRVGGVLEQLNCLIRSY